MVFLCASLARADINHLVRKGETLASIARSHGVSANTLTVHNRLSNPDRLSIGQVIRIPSTEPRNRQHAVKSGDTLSGIASRYGVRQADVVRLNSLARPDRLSIGQVLRIPGAGSTTAAGPTRSSRPQLPAGFKSQMDRQRVTSRKWTYIVIHHTGTARGSVKGIERYHKEERHMVNGMAYHFLIGNGQGMTDGLVAMGNRWKRQIKGGHLASEALNAKSIGICLVGNFETSRPTAAQSRSLKALVDYLMTRTSIKRSAVKKHGEINTKPTSCPGKNFSMSALWR